ncbi:TPA: hypothetical protein DIS56_00230 [Candidatus Saccharibacteria bacterium]|nr:MAG: hypothetical protein UX30_C0005G0046 [Candidatus Saccharibacteria bacterium GW2011_GWA2_46_10]HCM51556.1 hypothetical protein [Candidatus Saccharibacteria bacterium]
MKFNFETGRATVRGQEINAPAEMFDASRRQSEPTKNEMAWKSKKYDENDEREINMLGLVPVIVRTVRRELKVSETTLGFAKKSLKQLNREKRLCLRSLTPPESGDEVTRRGRLGRRVLFGFWK